MLAKTCDAEVVLGPAVRATLRMVTTERRHMLAVGLLDEYRRIRRTGCAGVLVARLCSRFTYRIMERRAGVNSAGSPHWAWQRDPLLVVPKRRVAVGLFAPMQREHDPSGMPGRVPSLLRLQFTQ